MNKILLGVTAFALMLTSCQKSEIIDDVNTGKNELDFGVYQGKANASYQGGSKAAELTNSELNQPGVNFPIHVYRGAQAGEKKVYFNEVLTYGSPLANKWNTSIPRFLVDEAPLQFYAFYAPGAVGGVVPGATYYPIAAADITTPIGYPTLDYTVQSKNVDLVAASVNDNQGTAVTIPFKHILSQINFGVKGYYGAKIKVSNIVVNQVYNRGVFSFNPDPLKWGWTSHSGMADYGYTFAGGEDASKSSFRTFGEGLVGTPETESECVYILGDGGNWGPGSDPVNSTNIWYINNSGVAVQGSTIDAATPKLANSLMLMPQILVKDMTKAFVTFDYTIQDLENKYVVGTETTPANGKFDLNMGNGTNAYADQWKPNLRYVYIIDFTGYLDGQLLSFTVDVESNPWENYDKPGEGLVLVSSLGQPIFKDSVMDLPVRGNFDIPVGNVFSNIIWDWSPYTMGAVFNAAGQTFTVDFKNVRFNGNTITVSAPKGFEVSTDGSTYVDAPVAVQSAATKLTFKKK